MIFRSDDDLPHLSDDECTALADAAADARDPEVRRLLLGIRETYRRKPYLGISRAIMKAHALYRFPPDFDVQSAENFARAVAQYVIDDLADP